MGKPTGFKDFERDAAPYRDAQTRVSDFAEIYTVHDAPRLTTQGARCMDCGVPFCQSDDGCPIYNLIPEWNDLVYRGHWRDALDRLHKTNNFPEFTGRVCPAPCEGACVLGITSPAVTIKNIEMAIIDRGFEEGWVIPEPPAHRTGKRVAIVGSGPAGLSAAAQLNKAGHSVTVYERDDRIGGLLMYGIPNMKLEKKGVVERRIDILRAEGVEFFANSAVGDGNNGTLSGAQLCYDNDALLLTTGATHPRSVPLRCKRLPLLGMVAQ
ncbi:MAG: glutamate synthase subunit beta [Chromatiales bacterium]|nr:glutamate synthase subunit beta [Chromatiales bacterium]